MKKADFNSLVETIPTLTPDQVKALKDRLILSDKLGVGKGTQKKDPLAEMLYDSIQDRLKHHGQQIPSYNAFKGMDLHKTYIKQLDLVRPFFTQMEEGEQLVKVKKLAAYNTCIKLLLEMTTLPKTLKTIVTQLHLIPSVVDQAFPGYLEEGLLLWAFDLNMVEAID